MPADETDVRYWLRILMIVKLIIMKFKQLIENEKREIRKRTDREMN